MKQEYRFYTWEDTFIKFFDTDELAIAFAKDVNRRIDIVVTASGKVIWRRVDKPVLTIDQIKRNKAILETLIKNLLNQFQKDNQIKVDSVWLSHDEEIGKLINEIISIEIVSKI
jgi:hypothetical protein